MNIFWVVFFLEEKERHIWRTRRTEGWKKRRIHYPCCVFFPLDVVVDEALCVCCLFSVSSGSNWWISDDYSNVGGQQKDKLWRKKRKGNCVVWRRSVTARPLSVFVFFCSFFLPFFQSFGGGSAGGPPRRENIRRFIPRSVQSVCVVFSKRKRYLKINSSSVRSVFVCPRR